MIVGKSLGKRECKLSFSSLGSLPPPLCVSSYPLPRMSSYQKLLVQVCHQARRAISYPAPSLHASEANCLHSQRLAIKAKQILGKKGGKDSTRYSCNDPKRK